MSEYTPAQARELAHAIQADLHVPNLPEVLHSLADQIEALTAERDVLATVVASYERVGIVAFDGMNATVGWTKPVRHNTMLFAVKEPK